MKIINFLIRYMIRVGDATSQWLNVVCLLGDANESISGRSYRLRTKPQWKVMMTTIDLIFSPFEIDHCKKAFEADYNRAVTLIGEQ